MSKIAKEPIILLAYGERIVGWSGGKLLGDKEWCAEAEFASQAKLSQYLYHDGPRVTANLQGNILEVFSALYYYAGDRTRILDSPEELLEAIVIGYSENSSKEEDEYYTNSPTIFMIDGDPYLVS